MLLAHASPHLRISGGAFLSRHSRFYLFFVANHKNGCLSNERCLIPVSRSFILVGMIHFSTVVHAVHHKGKPNVFFV